MCFCVHVYNKVLEQYKAAELEIVVTIIMPSEQKKSIQAALEEAKGLRRVSEAVSNIDVDEAKASRPEDLKRVKEVIEKDVGIEAVNKKVRKSMVDMAVKECASLLFEGLDDKVE